VSQEVSKLKRQLSAKEKQIDKHKLEAVKKEEEHQKEIAKHKQAVSDLRDESVRLKKVVKKHADTYMMEMKKALSTAILAAFAFLMALSWREYITEIIDSILQYSPAQGKLVSAVLVTVISVLGIVIVTRLLQVKES